MFPEVNWKSPFGEHLKECLSSQGTITAGYIQPVALLNHSINILLHGFYYFSVQLAELLRVCCSQAPRVQKTVHFVAHIPLPDSAAPRNLEIRYPFSCHGEDSFLWQLQVSRWGLRQVPLQVLRGGRECAAGTRIERAKASWRVFELWNLLSQKANVQGLRECNLTTRRGGGESWGEKYHKGARRVEMVVHGLSLQPHG